MACSRPWAAGGWRTRRHRTPRRPGRTQAAPSASCRRRACARPPCSAARQGRPSVCDVGAHGCRSSDTCPTAHRILHRQQCCPSNLVLLMCHRAAVGAMCFHLQVKHKQALAPAVPHPTAHIGHITHAFALQQDLPPAAAAPKLEGRSSRGPAVAAAPLLGRTSDPLLRLKTEPLPHGAELGAVPSSAATMLAVRAFNAVYPVSVLVVGHVSYMTSDKHFKPA
jgi:hypothetical protein